MPNVYPMLKLRNLIDTYRIFESGIPVAPFWWSGCTLPPDAVVGGDTVETVRIQGYWATSFTVIEPRLPFPHYKLQIISWTVMEFHFLDNFTLAWWMQGRTHSKLYIYNTLCFLLHQENKNFKSELDSNLILTVCFTNCKKRIILLWAETDPTSAVHCQA